MNLFRLWGVIVAIVFLTISSIGNAAPCTTLCDLTKPGEADNCLKELLAAPDGCFTADLACDASTKVNIKKPTDITPTSSPFSLTCEAKKTITLRVASKEQLQLFAEKDMGIEIGGKQFTAKVPNIVTSTSATGASAATIGTISSTGNATPCTTVCDLTKTDEAHNCFKDLVNEQKDCFIASLACDAGTKVTIKKPTDITPTSSPFSVTCDAGKITLRVASKEQLQLFATEDMTIEIGGQEFTAKVPEQETPAPAATTTTGENESALPIDVEPRPTKLEEKFKGKGERTAYIYVHENLSVDPESAKFATETDRVVVRFIARRALLCRYYATSDEKNEYKPEVGRVGGRSGLSELLKNWSYVGAGDEKSSSCGHDLERLSNAESGRFKPATKEGKEYDFVDFAFGPFTSEQLTFHVFRHDRQFKGNDLQSKVQVANHQRYVGWVDVAVVGTAMAGGNQEISVRAQNGTELTRIDVSEERHAVDIVAQVKFFALCSGSGNGLFQAQDLNEAAVCLGLGAGFSLTDPTERFYPIGLNLTVARYLSFNTFLVLERSKALADGYATGDLFSGSASDVPTNDRIVPGVAFGVGVDPTLVGELVGQIIKAGF